MPDRRNPHLFPPLYHTGSLFEAKYIQFVFSGEMDKSNQLLGIFSIRSTASRWMSVQTGAKKPRTNSKKAGLLEYVEFHIAKKHPHDSEEGIYESHMACIKKGCCPVPATSLYLKMMLLFDGFSPERLKQCIDFMRDTPDWKAFFFGCLVSGTRKRMARVCMQ